MKNIILKNPITGLYYTEETRSFTANRSNATALDLLGATTISYCFSHPSMNIPRPIQEIA